MVKLSLKLKHLKSLHAGFWCGLVCKADIRCMKKIFWREVKGVTLVELLVVIAIVAVVAAIAMPIFANTLKDGQAKWDESSQVNFAQFKSDWTSVGADFETVDGFVYAVVNNMTMARIQEVPEP